jgi:serine/threonine-protein kinase
MGFVEVVMKVDGRFERLYARKRLHPQHVTDARFRAMFLDEARLAGLIRHPNVVSVIDVGEDVDGPFLIMDLVDGQPVARLIARSRCATPPRPRAVCTPRTRLALLTACRCA